MSKPRNGLSVRRVFQPLFFHFGILFPNDAAGARVDELKIVMDIITDARAVSPRAQIRQHAGKEKSQRP